MMSEDILKDIHLVKKVFNVALTAWIIRNKNDIKCLNYLVLRDIHIQFQVLV